MHRLPLLACVLLFACARRADPAPPADTSSAQLPKPTGSSSLRDVMVRPEKAVMGAPETSPSLPFVLDAPTDGTLRIELVDRIGPVHSVEPEPRDPKCILLADLPIEGGKPLPFTLTFELTIREGGAPDLRALLQTKNATTAVPVDAARRSSAGAHLTGSSVHEPLRLMPGHYLHLSWWIWTRSDGEFPNGDPPPVRENSPEPAWYLRVRFTPSAKK